MFEQHLSGVADGVEEAMRNLPLIACLLMISTVAASAQTNRNDGRDRTQSQSGTAQPGGQAPGAGAGAGAGVGAGRGAGTTSQSTGNTINQTSHGAGAINNQGGPLIINNHGKQ